MLLEKAVNALLASIDDPTNPEVLWRLQYEQQCSLDTSLQTRDRKILFSRSSSGLVFDDEIIEQVRKAWTIIVNGEEDDGFMKFPAREDQSNDDAGEE